MPRLGLRTFKRFKLVHTMHILCFVPPPKSVFLRFIHIALCRFSAPIVTA